ncbi:YjzD family protein [Aquibacillus sp. 3ASR75-11]|uniref:YjzD family protein n=1 Tax=Terrihalobacillus insolitus TaxID=2950438 RepID=A0A9X3WWX4_9BACI|nr:YjzD family protein [Terrihalobacillus insolitus]MDC3413699.1 YjzD family protein [Terrihalobacillus insolitus]MDC3426283.1 YjzD family protein [Terrihalobacillus insolitus]
MRLLITIFWTFLLSFMISYVISNMGGGTFSISQVLALTGIFTIAVLLLGEGVLKESQNE